MSPEKLALLREGIARSAGIVLSLPSAAIFRHHKSRFLAEEADGIWVESAPSDHLLVQELIACQQPVAISFKSGSVTITLASPIRRHDPEYQLNAETTVSAILIAHPEHIKAAQRRASYRVRVAANDGVVLRIWRIAQRAYLGDRPLAAQEIRCELRDLSVTGMGVWLSGKDGQPPLASIEDRLRIELTHGDVALLVEGSMRHPTGKMSTPEVAAGIQFQRLEEDIHGRQKMAQLTKIIGDLQREEIRRTRRGA